MKLISLLSLVVIAIGLGFSNYSKADFDRAPLNSWLRPIVGAYQGKLTSLSPNDLSSAPAYVSFPNCADFEIVSNDNSSYEIRMGEVRYEKKHFEPMILLLNPFSAFLDGSADGVSSLEFKSISHSRDSLGFRSGKSIERIVLRKDRNRLKSLEYSNFHYFGPFSLFKDSTTAQTQFTCEF